MIKTIVDYYEELQNKFPDVPLLDIRKILNFGWKALYLRNASGGDVNISDCDFWCYFGELTNNSIKHYHYYIKKLIIKLRLTYKFKKIPWDGYYYFALTDSEWDNFLNQHNNKGRKRKTFYYGNLILYKLLDECKLKNHNRKYIFKVPFKVDLGFTYYKENYITDKAELIITRDKCKFEDILVSNNKYDILEWK